VPLLRNLPRLGLLLAFSCGLPGCSHEPSFPCHPVHGEVRLDGRPLADAVVVFHPLVSSTPPAPQPLAFTDSGGRFALTTVRKDDGAIAGDYAITVELRAPRTSGEETVRDGKNLLPARYAKPDASGLRYQVVVGDNEVPRLELKSR